MATAPSQYQTVYNVRYIAQTDPDQQVW